MFRFRYIGASVNLLREIVNIGICKHVEDGICLQAVNSVLSRHISLRQRCLYYNIAYFYTIVLYYSSTYFFYSQIQHIILFFYSQQGRF